jgi:MOSC domain-containing protein YiiM
VHHYPFEHYAAWCRELPDLAERFRTGGFGENISTVGLTEQNVCVGDQFSLGTARIQVAQARQPCWKLGVRSASRTCPGASRPALAPAGITACWSRAWSRPETNFA